MSVRALLRSCATDLLETEPSVTVEQVVACAYRNHRDEFADESERMVLNHARLVVAQILREFIDDDDDPEQLSFEGLGLPSAICVQHEDGTYYVRADKARWHELQAGRRVRVDNVTSAQRKLDRYDEALEELRPHMEAHPDRSVAEAMHARQASVS